MIPNRLGLAARSFVVIVAAAAWVPPSAAAGALPVQSVRPSEPRNVTATASGSIVDLAWQAPTLGRPITRYQVECVDKRWRHVEPSRGRGRQPDRLYAPGPPGGRHAPLPGEGDERHRLGALDGTPRSGHHNAGHGDTFGALESDGDRLRLDRRPRLGPPRSRPAAARSPSMRSMCP